MKHEFCEPKEWDYILGPHKEWFKLNLSAVWEYRDLIVLFVRRDLVSVYQQTILGPLWFVIQPILTSLTFLVIFREAVESRTLDSLSKFLFYFCNLVCWNYFGDCVNKTSGTFTQNAGIFGKVYFPRLTVPLSMVVSSMISFAIQCSIFIILLLYCFLRGGAVNPSRYVCLVPLLIVIMASLGLGVGAIVSSLTTKYRDLRFLVAFGIQLLMYFSCVIFPAADIQSPVIRRLILLNPMSILIEAFRYAFLGQGYFSWYALGYCSVVTLFILLFGLVIFCRVEKDFVDTI